MKEEIKKLDALDPMFVMCAKQSSLEVSGYHYCLYTIDNKTFVLENKDTGNCIEYTAGVPFFPLNTYNAIQLIVNNHSIYMDTKLSKRISLFHTKQGIKEILWDIVTWKFNLVALKLNLLRLFKIERDSITSEQP